MSKQVKRSGGKRPRNEKGSSREVQSFSPVNFTPQSSSAYSNASFSDAYQPSLEASSGGSNYQHQQLLSVNTQAAPAGKVAIPALRTPHTTDSSKSFKKGRTAHACDNCRKAKAGCSGGQPCSRCETTGSACVYGDGKRDREKKEMSKLSKETNHLTRHNAEVMEALRRIRQDTAMSPDAMRGAINDVLSMTPVSPTADYRQYSLMSARQSLEPEENDDSGEQDADAEVGSTGSLDIAEVDADQDETRGTGHMGKSSAVSWQKRTADECRRESFSGSGITGPTLASYHTEDADMEYFDTTDVSIFSWPDSQLADMLVQSYFDHVHNAFPVLNKEDFLFKYRAFPRDSGNLSVDEHIWLGILNAIFAISAVHAHLMRSRNRGHHFDHLIYISRAIKLCEGQEIFLHDARVSSTCAMALLSLYYISTCRLNRAWTMCGLAIRHALTLGLHVRSEANNLSDVEKEHRVRIWWSLYTLECSLNELTGRPTCITDRDISTPMPINVEEDELNSGHRLYDIMEDVQTSGPSSRRGSRDARASKNRPAATYQMPTGYKQPLALNFPVVSLPVTSSTYFVYRTQLSIVAHEIVTELYCAATIKEKWSDVESTIFRIDQRLLSWARSLPPEYDIAFDTYTKPDTSDPNTLSRTGLAMLFNSSRMILFRPCLCRFEGKILHQSSHSKNFNQDSVKKCVHSARRTIAILTWFATSPSKLFAIPPFWNTLHCLCEALSVLMLEMAFHSQHLPNETAEILDDAKKGIRWLIMMSEQSVSARKAWEIFDGLMRLVAPMIKWSVYDMPTEAPVPPGYNYGRVNTASQVSDFQGIQQQHQPQQMAGGDVDQYPGTSSTGAISAWGNQEAQQYPNFNTTYATAPPQFEVASNPLDNSAVAQRFFSIGQLHGHYDDPWQHLFNVTTAAGDLGIVAPDLDMMGQGNGQNMGMGGGQGYTQHQQHQDF